LGIQALAVQTFRCSSRVSFLRKSFDAIRSRGGKPKESGKSRIALRPDQGPCAMAAGETMTSSFQIPLVGQGSCPTAPKRLANQRGPQSITDLQIFAIK
jgi:hypothetical protein